VCRRSLAPVWSLFNQADHGHINRGQLLLSYETITSLSDFDARGVFSREPRPVRLAR
jgi:hypothetical protein